MRLRSALAQSHECQKADEAEHRRLQASLDQLRLDYDRLTSQVPSVTPTVYSNCVVWRGS